MTEPKDRQASAALEGVTVTDEMVEVAATRIAESMVYSGYCEPTRWALVQRNMFLARTYARLALESAHSGVRVPEGYALVPVEPTVEQIKAGCDVPLTGRFVSAIYRAMLASSPKPHQ